jgi:hypothetical protein
LKRLLEEPDFRRHEQEGFLTGPARRSAWRRMEAWAMAALTEPQGAVQPGALSGRLSHAARRVLWDCLDALAVPKPDAALAELSRELSRHTPYRARLFRVLAERTLKRGRPAVLVPVAYRVEPDLAAELKEAWALERSGHGRVRARTADAPLEVWEGSVEEFAARFGEANFP